MKFKARAGYYHINQEQAQLIGDTLYSFFPHGQITAEDVLKVSEPTNSPLHRYFEWDDQRAANSYRLDQARKLIRSIVIEVDGQDVPAYHSVLLEETGERSYVDAVQCLKSEDLWSQVLKTALKEAEYWSEKYKSYKDLEPIRVSINQTKQEVLRNV